MRNMQRVDLSDDSDDFDENGVLKDAHSFRVPMLMADSNRARRRTLDASASLPGFRSPTSTTMTDAELVKAARKIDRAYKQADFIARHAWRGPDADADEMDALYDAEVGGDDDDDDDMVFSEVTPEEFIAARNNVHGGKRGNKHSRTVTRDFSAVDAEYQRYDQTISRMWRSK